MKMEKKQCTKCKKDLEISLFNLRGGQLTKCCVKCLDNFKKSRQRTRCDMEDKDQNARIVAGTIFVSITREDHDARIMVGVKFVNTTSKDQHAKIAVEVEFVSTTGEDLRPKIMAEVKFVSTTSKDQYVKIVAEDCGRSQICEHNKQRSECLVCNPLGHLVGSCNVVFMLP